MTKLYQNYSELEVELKLFGYEVSELNSRELKKTLTRAGGVYQLEMHDSKVAKNVYESIQVHNKDSNDMKHNVERILRESISILIDNQHVPNDILDIIIAYAGDDDMKSQLIKHTLSQHIKTRYLFVSFFNIFCVIKIFFDIFLLVLVLIYIFTDDKFISVNTSEIGWTRYKMFCASLIVSYWTPNFLSTFAIMCVCICQYVDNTGARIIGKYMSGINDTLVMYYVIKFGVQCLITIVFIPVGMISIIPLGILFPSYFAVEWRQMEKILSWSMTMHIVGMAFLLPIGYFAAFNLVSGHMWVVASFRPFLGWEACYHNSPFLSDGIENYSWTELIVYFNYWLI